MKKLLLISTVLASPAFAADLPVSKVQAQYTPITWQGLYISGYGLYGANLTNTTINIKTNVADLASAPHGPGFGGSVGYFFQPGGIVWGPRFDLAYANLQGGGSVASQLSVSNATNYLGDADLILGLPLGDGKLLGYVGGGFAFGGAKPNLSAIGTAASISDTSTGWNVLAGLAYQLSPNWQVFIEGNYFQLGDKSLTLADGVTSLTKYHIFEQKLGMSYKF